MVLEWLNFTTKGVSSLIVLEMLIFSVGGIFLNGPGMIVFDAVGIFQNSPEW